METTKLTIKQIKMTSKPIKPLWQFEQRSENDAQFTNQDLDWHLWLTKSVLKAAWLTTKILIDAPVLQPDCNAIQAISLLKQNCWQRLLKTCQLLTNLVLKGQLALNGLQVLAANQNMILINQIPSLQLVETLVEKLEIDFIYVINDEQLIKVKNWLKQAKGHWNNYQIVKISNEFINLKKAIA